MCERQRLPRDRQLEVTAVVRQVVVLEIDRVPRRVHDLDQLRAIGRECELGEEQVIGLVGGGPLREFGVVEITKASSNLPVGTLQAFLDVFLNEGGAEKIDYVHGEDVTVKLGSQPNNAGFYLPGMHKSDLFKTVILDGALPRKTFSMGEAREKRFYMEARKIS